MSPRDGSTRSPVTNRDFDQARIRIADEHLDPRAIEQQFKQLHATLGNLVDTSWYDSLVGRSTLPSVEWVLTTNGGGTVEYYVGCESEHFEIVLGACEGLFPDSYDVTPVDWNPLEHRDPGPVDRLSVGGVEFYGKPDWRNDWRTRLTPLADAYSAGTDGVRRTKDASGTVRVPLTTVLQAMTTADVSVAYQAVVRPYPDHTATANLHQHCYENNQRTGLGGWLDMLTGADLERSDEPSSAHRTRIEELDARDHAHCFVVNPRIVAVGDENAVDSVTTQLQGALADISHTGYSIEGKQRIGALGVLDDLVDRTVHPPTYDTLGKRLPVVSTASRGIVAAPDEVGSFCLLDGAGLTTAARRAVASTPGERTTVPSPPESMLDDYRGEGIVLGRSVTDGGRSSESR